MQTLTLARFILEFALMDYTTIHLSDSLMACAALFIALRMNKCEGWNAAYEYYSGMLQEIFCYSDCVVKQISPLGYKLVDFAPVVVLLNTLLHKKPKDSISTVRNKYSHTIFHKVTSIPLLDINVLFEKYPDVTETLSNTPLTYNMVVEKCSPSALAEKKNLAKYEKATQSFNFPPNSLPLPVFR
jgi:hypothetical protein